MRRACVIGWPVEHSRSPLIHGTWLKRHGIDGAYGKVAMPPDGANHDSTTTAFLHGLAGAGYVGCNVTVPHKETAFAAVDARTATADAVGAVNTVWVDDVGRLHGDNTDVYGFLANLDEAAPGWADARRPALVIGAGGSARAVIHGLLARGVPGITVLNRSPERLAGLLSTFAGDPRIVAGGFDRLDAALGEAGLIVNTTSAGLKGEDALPLDWRRAQPDAVATDLTYVPLVTPFLADARDRGLRIVDGLGMLLHQAAPGFERWFGIRPEVDAALREIVVADLAR